METVHTDNRIYLIEGLLALTAEARTSVRHTGPAGVPRSYGLFQPDHADVRRPDQWILLPTPLRGLPQDAANTEPVDRHTVLIRSQLTLYTLWAAFESLTANQ